MEKIYHQVDFTESLLWIFAVAVFLLILFVVLRLVGNNDRIFDYYGPDTKVCKYCGQSYVKWNFKNGRVLSSIWIVPEYKEPVDKKCKCQKIINPEEYENS